MVNDIVLQVLRDDSDRRKIAAPSPTTAAINNGNNSNSGSNSSNNTSATSDSIIGQPCPLCGKGRIIKGRTAYGCSEWKNGCEWRKTF